MRKKRKSVGLILKFPFLVCWFMCSVSLHQVLVLWFIRFQPIFILSVCKLHELLEIFSRSASESAEKRGKQATAYFWCSLNEINTRSWWARCSARFWEFHLMDPTDAFPTRRYLWGTVSTHVTVLISCNATMKDEHDVATRWCDDMMRRNDSMRFNARRRYRQHRW